MPRVRYSGVFNPEQVPNRSPTERRGRSLAAYAEASGPKAAAIHPWGGRFFPVISGPTDAAAAVLALQTCNGDPERAGRDGPCFLYAVGNQVVLPERRLAFFP